jgi:hypothetical protein
MTALVIEQRLEFSVSKRTFNKMLILHPAYFDCARNLMTWWKIDKLSAQRLEDFNGIAKTVDIFLQNFKHFIDKIQISKLY